MQVSVAEDVFTGIKVGDTASVTVSAVSKEPMNGTVSTLPAAANVQTNLYDVSVALPSGTKPPIGALLPSPSIPTAAQARFPCRPSPS
mgnify:CR=1 FL=1